MAMPDQDGVIDANHAFYRAFTGRDLNAMDLLWARRAPVACIHPGWDALIGRAAVMASWRDLLSQPTSPAIRCQAEQVLLHGDTACVICQEALEGGVLIATNLFVREDGAWRMVHHQAGGVAEPATRAPGAHLH
jgi:hypothetical protein